MNENINAVMEEVTEEVVTTNSANWLKTAGKCGLVAAVGIGLAVAIKKVITVVKAKKQQDEETTCEILEVEDVDSVESDEE